MKQITAIIAIIIISHNIFIALSFSLGKHIGDIIIR